MRFIAFLLYEGVIATAEFNNKPQGIPKVRAVAAEFFCWPSAAEGV
jgi:hypothetical protein